MARPPVPIEDVLFLIGARVYGTKSGAESQWQVEQFFQQGLLTQSNARKPRPPSESKITKAFRDPKVADAFQSAIRATADCVKERETIFAIDGCEFNIPNRYGYDRAPEDVPQDAGPRELRVPTVKAMYVVGTATKICVAAEVIPGKGSEHNEFVKLIDRIRGRFRVAAVAADKAYWGADILEYLREIGAYAAIPPKSNTASDNDGILARHLRHWIERTEDEKSIYGLRQLSEAFHSIVKRRMTENLLSRTFPAQACELLAMTVIANIIRLVYLYVEDPTFEIPFASKRARELLDKARESVSGLPRPSKEPREPRKKVA